MSRGTLRGRSGVAVVLLLPLLAGCLAAQGRRQRRPAPNAVAQQRQRAGLERARLALTAQTDLDRQDYAAAARAFESLLRLAPGDTAAQAGLALAQAGGCREAAWQTAAASAFAAAARQLAACGPNSANQPASIQLAALGAFQNALAGANWSAAESALPPLAHALANAPLPPQLGSTLAPAYLRLAVGDARGAAALARRQPGDATAGLFAFLRYRYRHRVWRAALAPALAAWFILLVVSLIAGLRGILPRRPAQPEAA